MTFDQKYHQAIEVLKTFNQAVTTSRLYPAVSPQVSLAVEKAYKVTKNYVRQHHELSFGSSGSDSLLFGEVVPEEVKQELHALVVYRHLDLLKVDHFVLKSGFDRVAFNRILSVFIARKEKINREGGGRFFVGSLGLEQFFPEVYESLTESVGSHEEPEVEKLINSIDSVLTEQLDYLFGEHNRKDVQNSLQKRLTARDGAVDIVVGGIARFLEYFSKLKNDDFFPASAPFARFIESTGKMIPVEELEFVVGRTTEKVLETIDERLLCALLAQTYHEGFGALLSSSLVERTQNELFDKAIALLREKKDYLIQRKKEETPQARTVSEITDKLLDSVKGKQFLGREKAKSLLKTGEKERQSKRLETGISALMQGNTDSLQSDEIVFSLPSAVDQLIGQGKPDEAFRIIERVANEMVGGDDKLRKRLIQCLILIAEKLFDDEKWDWLEKITGALISWIRESDDGDFIYEKTVSILQAIMDHAWGGDNYSRGDQILSVLYKIRSGQLQKSAPILALIGRIQDRSYNRDQIEKFLRLHLKDKGDGQFGKRLSMLGRTAGNHLIDELLKNEDTEERLKLVEVLSNMGQIIIPVMEERLKEPMPWYGKRNLIKLAAEVAGPEQVDVITPFLTHEDIRVQREAFVCIYIISGEQRRTALIKCLSESSEVMYPQIVKAFLPHSDGEIAELLAVLLEDQEQFSESIRESLVLETLKVLARSKSRTARKAIRQFIERKGNKANKKLKNIVWDIAEASFMQLEESLGINDNVVIAGKEAIKKSKDLVQTKKVPVSADSQKPQKKKKQKPQKDYSGLPEADKVTKLLSGKEMEKARELLSELIGKMARERRFDEAEKLREWLMDEDPMALTEIIRGAEIIEEEKVASVDSDHAETWADLYDVLSTEEFATLYHAMERKTYSNEELIVKQGSMQSGLYFISNGKVKVFFKDKRGEVLVKVASRGEILGSETVFDASVWTISAASMSRTDIMILKTDKLITWRDDYPSLESKLSDFCMKSESLKQFFKVSGKDRRQSKRHRISGRSNNMLLDSKGQDTGISSKGDLFDIASGGVSFYLRISQKKNSKLLLGRGIRVTIPTEGTLSKQLAVTGVIIAVRGHQAMDNEYSVHVKFNTELAGTEVQAIVKAAKQII